MAVKMGAVEGRDVSLEYPHRWIWWLDHLDWWGSIRDLTPSYDQHQFLKPLQTGRYLFIVKLSNDLVCFHHKSQNPDKTSQTVSMPSTKTLDVLLDPLGLFKWITSIGVLLISHLSIIHNFPDGAQMQCCGGHQHFGCVNVIWYRLPIGLRLVSNLWFSHIANRDICNPVWWSPVLYCPFLIKSPRLAHTKQPI